MITTALIGLICFVAGAAGAGVYTWHWQRKVAKANIEQQTDIITAAGHALRSHLNNMLGHSQLLSSRSKQYRSEDQHLIESVLGSGGDLRRILLDTLETIELKTDRLKIEPEETRLDQMIQSLCAAQTTKAKRADNDLAIDLHPSTKGWFALDHLRVTQCINALLGQCNFQATKATLRLGATVTQKSSTDRQLQITIVDPNAGLHQYQAEAYFEPKAFFRNKHLSKESPWRLSVMLARLIAREMGGDLQTKSQASGELKFILTLPVTFIKKVTKELDEDMPLDIATEIAPTKTKRAAHDEGQARVLIAEDDPTNLIILEALLSSLGYTNIVSVTNGAEVLEQLKAAPFDLLLTDISMPEMDGIEATETIRDARQPWSTIPIIAVSATATPHRARAMEAGVDGFLSKPLLKDELLVVIKEQLDKSNAPRRVAA